MPDLSAPSQKEIFLAASGIAGAAERARYLDDACGGNAELRARVESLLAAEVPEHFMAAPGGELDVAAMPASGASIGYFGDYVLLAELARGASGVVFRARQASLNRVVALKMLRDGGHLASEEERRRFRAEAAAAASLDHPGIVPIYEVGEHEGQGYFSMKLIEGGTLVFRGAEFRAPRKAAALIAQVARAVHHAHQHGILHRDLKPGNILLDRDGAPHVVDFGIARHLGVDSGLTRTGQVVGTPHYMAPEQARGENRALTPAADIYSLGAVLYELLAGRKPFDADSMLTLLQQVAAQPPAPLRIGDCDLENIVLHCMEKSPSARYGSAAELADDLERWLRGEPVNARPVGIAAQLAKWVRRRPAPAALAALCCAGLVYFAVRQLDSAPRRETPPMEMTAAPTPAAVPVISPPAQPAASSSALVNADPAAARRTLEWLHRVNAPNGKVRIQKPGQAPLDAVPGEPLPDGDFIIIEIMFDHYNAPAALPRLDPAEFREHAATLRHLRSCFLRAVPLRADDLAFLAHNPGLEQLIIEQLPVGDGLLPHLAGLKKLRDLVMVHSAGKGDELTGSRFDTLAFLPVLETTNLYGSSVGDDAIAILAARCPRLKSLHLAGTRITDASLRILNQRPLNDLRIGDNRAISDVGLAELSKIPSLRVLDLQNMPGLSAGAIEAFQKAHPYCEILR